MSKKPSNRFTDVLHGRVIGHEPVSEREQTIARKRTLALIHNEYETINKIIDDHTNWILLTKGWSKDKKYYVKTDEHEYLIRTSDKENHNKKLDLFYEMAKLEKTSVRFSKAYDIKLLKEKTYMSFEWVNGIDLNDCIDTYTNEKQYNLGYKAGQYLKRIHELPYIDSNDMDWSQHFNHKLDVKIEKYLQCPIHYVHGDVFIKYINKHRHLLKDRTVVFQHGDYHIGNMMIDEEGELIIIDFDRSDYGDGWEEFNRIVWCKERSIDFSVAMINGYFNDNVPNEFWKLLKLYIFQNSLGSIYWAIPYGEDQVDVMIKQSNEIASWYDEDCDIPRWYKEYDNG